MPYITLRDRRKCSTRFSQQRRKAVVALMLAGALALGAVSLGVVVWDMKSRASVAPSPSALSLLAGAYREPFEADVSPDASSDGFPDVDWEYWKRENPRIIGWLTVPDTPIDYPVVQAPEDDPDYYLSHDVYGSRNIFGCTYLDAECAQNGLLNSENAVIFGHNMSNMDGSMFTAFSRYGDEGFASAHKTILVQTPEKKVRLRVVGVCVSPGDSATKRTAFQDKGDFESYCQERLLACDVRLDGWDVRDSDQLFTFVTCSYTRYANERTLVYAVLE